MIQRLPYALALCLGIIAAQAQQRPATKVARYSKAVSPPEQVRFEPVILVRSLRDDKVVALRLAPRIATSIRLPEPVNSVVLGDPANFQAEHSEREPDRVTVKPVTDQAAQTNLLITTTHGHELNLLLRSPGAHVTGGQPVDVLLTYQLPKSRSFLLEESTFPTSLVAETTRLDTGDILGGQVGASVKKLSEIFARARENNPSIIFFDEIDGLLPRNNGILSTHDAQLVEQCRTEISQLQPEHNVFLIGTTNHLDRIDPAILRGGRFSEKIVIGPPGPANRERLLRRYLDGIQLDVAINRVVERLAGLAPADIEAICKAAVRNAFGRSEQDNHIPPLVWDDFERAIQRVAIQP